MFSTRLHALPHDQDFYDRQAQSEQVLLLAEASRLEGRGTPGDEDRAQSSDVAVGIGEIVTTTGAGSQTASLMRFVPEHDRRCGSGTRSSGRVSTRRSTIP